MDNWIRFLDAADQWLISYSLPPALMAVKLFEIGHVVELYLKAANTKMTGDIKRSIKFGHKIKQIWDDCKSRDKAFMPNYEIRQHVYDSDFMHNPWNNLFNQDDFMHFVHNQELYITAKHLPDLKYLGLPPKTMAEPNSMGMVHPSDYWIDFLKELRTYLEYPADNMRDWIRMKIEMKELPYNSALYLNQLYDTNPPIPDLADYYAALIVSPIRKILKDKSS